MTIETCDAVVVGGGPAGLAAAEVMKANGLDVCLLDEQPRLGGQIYRQPPSSFQVDSWLTDRVYQSGKALLERVERLEGIRHVASSTVWALMPARPGVSDGTHRVLYERSGAIGRIESRHVLLATGCYEAPVPFPGWELPGVMSAGGVQTLLKSQRVAAGRNIVLAGSHPLLLIAAEQLLHAGVRVSAVVLSQSLSQLGRLLFAPMALLGASEQMRHGWSCLSRLRRARVPVMSGKLVVEALGKDAVEAVRIGNASLRGESSVMTCDCVGICYGFAASSELARQAGVRSFWETGSGWVVSADALMRSSVQGISVAGELIGVAGAESAALSGEIAGLGIVVDAGRVPVAGVLCRVRMLRRRLHTLRRFGQMLAEIAAPPLQMLRGLATPETLVCRCEDVGVRQVADALCENPGVASASAVKLLTRTGMGMCQGRMCEHAVRRLIAEHHGVDLETVAGFTPQAPVKPVPLGSLAAQADVTPALASVPVA